MYDLLIKNGTVVGKSGMQRLDVGVKDEKVVALAPHLDGPAVALRDASGLLVFPGGVDCHAHLNEPGYTWREDYPHGTRAAAAGGVTTVVDMPLQNTPPLTNSWAFAHKADALRGRAYVDYAFLGGLIDDNLSEIEGLHAAGAVGLKAFLSPSTPDFPSAPLGVVYEAMQKAAKWDVLLAFHCEDYGLITHLTRRARNAGLNSWRAYLDSRPVVAEEIATQNILDMALATGARVHICHVSHPAVAARIRRAQQAGARVTAETCAHYLVFSEADLLAGGGVYKCSPPLRTKEAVDGLWEYVWDGTLSSIVSDHSPAAPEEKGEALSVWDVWGGISGIQSALQVMYAYVVNRRGGSPCKLAGLLSENAADNFRLKGKGKIALGYDADLVLFDPQKAWTITPESLYYLNQISAYCGLSGSGLPVATYVRGHEVFADGQFAAERPGRLLLAH